MEQKDTAKKIIRCSPDILLRGSIFVVMMRIILVVVIFSILRLFIRIPLIMFEFSRESVLQMFSLNTILALVSVIAEVVFVLYVTLGWVHEYYEISPGQIMQRRGVFVVKENAFTFDRIQTIEVFQGFLGKIFNFGSLTIYNPALDRKVVLYNIDNPTRYKGVIEEVVNVEIDPQKEHNTVYVKGEHNNMGFS